MNKEIAPVVKQQVSKATKAVQELVINDEKSQALSIDILSKVKKVGKIIKEEKEKITKPLNEALKNARNLFAPYENQCAEAERIIKGKQIDYNNKVEEAERIEAERIAKRVEKGTMKIETATKKMEEIPQAQKSAEGKTGKISFKKVKMFEVEDLSKLPIEYHLADMVAIRKEMNAGKELPGVKYWEDKQVASR